MEAIRGKGGIQGLRKVNLIKYFLKPISNDILMLNWEHVKAFFLPSISALYFIFAILRWKSYFIFYRQSKSRKLQATEGRKQATMIIITKICTKNRETVKRWWHFCLIKMFSSIFCGFRKLMYGSDKYYFLYSLNFGLILI